MALPAGLRFHLWYRRQLRRLHIMRPLPPPTRCKTCDVAFSPRNPIGWPSGVCLDCQGVPMEDRWWLSGEVPEEYKDRLFV